MCRLDEIIDVEIAIAYVDLKKDSGFVERAISWWTRSPYYHVEIAVGDVWVTSAPNVGGVRVKKLKPLKDRYDYFKDTVQVTRRQLQQLHEWLETQEPAKYDYLGILLSQVLPFRIHRKDKWFCSEIVVKVLQLLLYKDTYNMTPATISPADLVAKFKPTEF